MEMIINSSFNELDEFNLIEIDGGTFWGAVGGVFMCIGGAASVVGGVALCLVPEPTTATKWAGGAMIAGGAAGFLAGCATVASNV